MFRKFFAAIAVAGLFFFFFSISYAAKYSVKKGDCLISIARRAGEPASEYKRLVELNSDRFASRSEDLVFIGESLEIPDEWASALGIVDLLPDPVPVAQVWSGIPLPRQSQDILGLPQEPRKGLGWIDFIIILALALLAILFVLCSFPLKWVERMNQGIKKVARRVRRRLKEEARSFIRFWFPTSRVAGRMFPGGLTPAGAGALMNGGLLEPAPTRRAFGLYEVEHRNRDGSASRNLAFMAGQRLAHKPGAPREGLLLGCGNVARRLAAAEAVIQASKKPAAELEREPAREARVERQPAKIARSLQCPGGSRHCKFN
ncbi:hypothetical protein CL633_03655 [bacterium]|nr:hypothetical protein [bacterium]|tara:strand:+ start:309 stop:1259 length:951 start_codon:yes stop_codon:yes gene_type:complete